MKVQAHQPLWGGFPMHYCKGDPENPDLTREWSEAQDYSKEDAEKAAAWFRKVAPNAVVQIKQ